jgi:hypothetical protein
MIVVAAVAALLLPGAGEKGDIVWMKLDQARVAAARAQKPILVLVMFDPKNGNSVCSKSSGVDRTLEDPGVAKRSGDFCFVRAADRKTAAEVRATRCLEVIFLDPDGEEVHRAEFKDAACLERSMVSAAESCSSRPVAWASTDGSLPAQTGAAGKPVVLVFADDRKESVDGLKALEDRSVASLHERFVFVKAPWKKDGEEAKRWGVVQAPSFVVVDPSDREVLERLGGRKPPRELRAALLRALGKVEKPEKK